MSVLAHQDVCDYIVGPEECDDTSKVPEDNLFSTAGEKDSALAFLEEEDESVCEVMRTTWDIFCTCPPLYHTYGSCQIH